MIQITAWAKTGISNHLLAMKPIKLNIGKLRLAPALETDKFMPVRKKAGTVLNLKTGKVEPIKINRVHSIVYENLLEAINKDNEVIGRVAFAPDNKSSIIFEDYGKRMYLECIGTNGNYKGIGTELVRRVIQASKDAGFGGKIRLSPSTGSVPERFQFDGFYNRCRQSSATIQYKKMGFKAFDPKVDKLLDEELASGGSGLVTNEMGEVLRDKWTSPMYMPENIANNYLK